MATSGSTAFDRTGEQICTHALKVIRVLGEDESISVNQLDDALVAMNGMVKSDQMKLGLWRKREARLWLVDTQANYNLTGANACDISELAETTLDAAEASGQTVLSVTSTSGFTNSDVIGIVLDDDTIHWTTISSFVANDTVTVASGLASAASNGKRVYVYTTAAPRPMKIIGARRLNGTTEIPMFDLSHTEYFELPNKASPGTPVQYHYDPQQGIGVIYLWPTPDTVDDMINYTYLDELEIFSANTNTSNFPSEWMEYLVYGLALRLSNIHGAEMPTAALAIYSNVISSLELWDAEDQSIIFEVA